MKFSHLNKKIHNNKNVLKIKITKKILINENDHYIDFSKQNNKIAIF